MLFNKLQKNATRLFHKIEKNAPGIGRKISSGVSNVLNKVSNYADELKDNKLLSYATGGSSNAILNGIADVSKAAGALTNYKTYRGNVNDVSGRILEKAQALKDTAKTAKENVFV